MYIVYLYYVCCAILNIYIYTYRYMYVCIYVYLFSMHIHVQYIQVYINFLPTFLLLFLTLTKSLNNECSRPLLAMRNNAASRYFRSGFIFQRRSMALYFTTQLQMLVAVGRSSILTTPVSDQVTTV